VGRWPRRPAVSLAVCTQDCTHLCTQFGAVVGSQNSESGCTDVLSNGRVPFDIELPARNPTLCGLHTISVSLKTRPVSRRS